MIFNYHKKELTRKIADQIYAAFIDLFFFPFDFISFTLSIIVYTVHKLLFDLFPFAIPSDSNLIVCFLYSVSFEVLSSTII